MNQRVNSNVMVLDGNEAAAMAMKMARVSVMAVYPITPQTPLAERLAQMVEKKEIEGKYICVESEHSAISYVIGAQLTGVRAGTATASVGLALMHEVLGVASGCRVPIVMPVVNRALVAPWSLWCDHQDAMAERDSGWLQVYAENAQEVLDLILMGYRIAEHENVLLPIMICMDGFYVSHSLQKVLVPEQVQVDKFIPKYEAKNLILDVKKPMFINNLTSPDEFCEMRYQQDVAFKNALVEIPRVQKEFKEAFGREYGLINSYECEDAEAVIVCMGSMSGTVKYVVKQLRKKNIKVGVVKITFFRPFPKKDLIEALSGVKTIGVIDRSAGLGSQTGPLGLEVARCLGNKDKNIINFVAGLGGRDITEEIIEKIYDNLLKLDFNEDKNWIDLKEDALHIRRYEMERGQSNE